jgi:uncharacterized damage-inducible protein DinB
MSTSNRIADQFAKLFDGDAWIDVNIMSTLRPLSAHQAAAKFLGNMNSIWEIVNHLIGWREAILKKLRGENIASPENNFFEPIINSSDKAWQETLVRLKASQQKWVEMVETMNEDQVDEVLTPASQTKYYLIEGILQHDAYHLGQIVLLKKFV